MLHSNCVLWGAFNKGIIYKGWWGNHKGLMFSWAGNIGLGVIICLRPEEVRELGGRGVVWRGPPYKNVAFMGACIPWCHLPPCLWSLARVPHLAEPHWKSGDKEAFECSQCRWASQAWSIGERDCDTRKTANAKPPLISLVPSLFSHSFSQHYWSPTVQALCQEIQQQTRQPSWNLQSLWLCQLGEAQTTARLKV